MSEHHAKVSWKRETPDFNYDTYDRTHSLTYPGGLTLKASSAPEFLGNAKFANPEEVLGSALASCHMLTFLAVAAKSRLIVDSYEDDAVATLDKNAAGKFCVTKIVLHPKVTFSSTTPVTVEKLNELHSKAHKNCFIANSLACTMSVEPHA